MSRHKGKDWIHPYHAEKTELVHITKGKTAFIPAMPNRHWIGPHHKRKDTESIPTNLKDWMGSHRKRKDWIPLNYVKRLNWFTSQKQRLNAFQLSQKTELFHITKGKIQLTLTTPKRLNWFTSQKERLNSSQPYPKVSMSSRYKRKDWMHPNHAQNSEFMHSAKGRDDWTISSWLCNRKHSSSSKCSTEKCHPCLSKVSQKLDYDIVTWKKIKLSRSPPQPRESHFYSIFEKTMWLWIDSYHKFVCAWNICIRAARTVRAHTIAENTK